MRFGALDNKKRYLQIAFNNTLSEALKILPQVPESDRILIEAGTPFIKREGISGLRALVSMWSGIVVADLKTTDGAIGEVDMVYSCGAQAATVSGSSPAETLNIFIKRCNDLNIISMIDLVGVSNPLQIMMKLNIPPQVVIIHRGRDEENTRGKVIEYKHINKIRSKYDVIISAAGGVDLRESQSAVFNGAGIVVVNIVDSDDPWEGIDNNSDIAKLAKQFLEGMD